MRTNSDTFKLAVATNPGPPHYAPFTAGHSRIGDCLRGRGPSPVYVSLARTTNTGGSLLAFRHCRRSWLFRFDGPPELSIPFQLSFSHNYLRYLPRFHEPLQSSNVALAE